MAETKRGALTDAETLLAKHQRALANLAVGRTTTSKEQVSFTRIEQVAGGLAHDWGRQTRLPAALAAAVRLLFRDTFRLEPSPGGLHMEWSGTIHVPLATGHTATLDIEGQVPQSSRSAPVRKDPRSLLEMRLATDASFEELGDAWGISGCGKKSSQLHRLLVRAITEGVDGRRVPTQLAARILLYSAPAETRSAIWRYIVGDKSTSSWEDQVRRTYSSTQFVFSETWVGRDHNLQRTAMDALISLDDAAAGLPILDAVEHLGLDYRKTCEQLTYRLRAGKATQPPPFITNWHSHGGYSLRASRALR